MWRWVTNCLSAEAEDCVASCAHTYGGAAMRGAFKPADHYNYILQDVPPDNNHGSSCGVYVDLDAWIAWVKRVNPTTDWTPERVDLFASGRMFWQRAWKWVTSKPEELEPLVTASDTTNSTEVDAARFRRMKENS